MKSSNYLNFFLNYIKNLVIFRHPVLMVIFFLGVSSGMSFGLLLSVLNLWLADIGIDNAIVGGFALIKLPQCTRFMWAPLIDNIKLPIIHKYGKRKSWLIVLQTFAFIFIERLGASDPMNEIGIVVFYAVMVSFLVASIDIVLDAYRIEALKQDDQIRGASSLTMGFKTGGLFSGGLLLILIEYMRTNSVCSEQYCHWYYGFLLIAVLSSLINYTVVLLATEPEATFVDKVKDTLEKKDFRKTIKKIKETITDPFNKFTENRGWKTIMMFIISYRVCDLFISAMKQPFLLDIGFTIGEIGLIVKTFGFISVVVGALLGNIIVKRIGLMRSLILFGILQAAANLMFILQYFYGTNTIMLCITVSVENSTESMGVAALTTYLSRICDRSYTATQYALFSSMSYFPLVVLSPLSGLLVNSVGWCNFFLISFLSIIPAITILVYQQKKIEDAMK